MRVRILAFTCILRWFAAVWQDERFQEMFIGALNWMTGQVK